MGLSAPTFILKEIPVKRVQGMVAVSVLLLLCASCAHRSARFDPQPDRARKLVIVETTKGRVAGFEAENGLHVFLGIPYAEPPVGRLRFAPPQPAANWAHVRPAYRFSPTCPQMEDAYEPASLLYQHEDCLSLNIWAPATRSSCPSCSAPSILRRALRSSDPTRPWGFQTP